MRMQSSILALGVAVGTVLGSGCVDPFDGSHMTFALNSNVRSPCEVLARYNLIGPKVCTGRLTEDRFLYHYEIWATLRRSAAVQLAPFSVQRALMNDPDAPDDVNRFEIFSLEKEGAILANGQPLKVGFEKYFSELTLAEQDEARTRMLAAGAKPAITGFAETMYSDAAAKRLAPEFYVGNHDQLTKPLNGRFYGLVETYHPYGAVILSGAELQIAPVLDDLDSLWVTIESDSPTRANPKPSSLIYLQGAARRPARGIVNVEATSPWDPAVSATFGVFTELGQEEYF